VASLDGVWEVKRRGGFLPPLTGVRKRISGARGETVVGRLRMPFDVRGQNLHYRWPFRGLVDMLEVVDDVHVRGRATFRGKEYGQFELRRMEMAQPNELQPSSA
jgi:hypothetical protein